VGRSKPRFGTLRRVRSTGLPLEGEHKAFLEEETDVQRLREHNERNGYIPESPLTKAVEQVFETVGDDIQFYKGVLSGSSDALERVKVRAGMAGTANSSVAYTSRQGTLHLPFDYALEVARKFCTAEPSTVLVGVETTEHEWSRKAATPGEEYIVPLLKRLPSVVGAAPAVGRIRCSGGSEGSRDSAT
jgi:hypothetical protein